MTQPGPILTRLERWRQRLGPSGPHHLKTQADPAPTAPSGRTLEFPSPPGDGGTDVANDDAAPVAQAGPPPIATDPPTTTSETRGTVASEVSMIANPSRTSPDVTVAPIVQPNRTTTPDGLAPVINAPASVNTQVVTVLRQDNARISQDDRANPPRLSAEPAPTVALPRARTFDWIAESSPIPMAAPNPSPSTEFGPGGPSPMGGAPTEPNATDLTRTNELLEQILAETRKRAVNYLPASGPGWAR